MQRVEHEGDQLVVVAFDTFAPMALAGIGKSIPDTVFDRSVILMLERAPRRSVEKFRRRRHGSEALALHRRCAAWAQRHAEEVDAVLNDASDLLPDEVSDRAQDVWEPLVQIALVADGEWPERAVTACVELNKHRDEIDQSDERLTVLECLRGLYLNDDGSTATKFWTTRDLANQLGNMGDCPFSEWNKGDGISQVQLARWMNKTFDIVTKPGLAKGSELRGYWLDQLSHLFEVYLSPLPVGGDVSAEGSGDGSEGYTDTLPDTLPDTSPPTRGVANTNGRKSPGSRGAGKPINVSKRPPRRAPVDGSEHNGTALPRCPVDGAKPSIRLVLAKKVQRR